MMKVPRQNIVVTAIYETPIHNVRNNLQNTDIEIIEDEDKALEEAERLLNNDIGESSNRDDIKEIQCKDGVCDISSVLKESPTIKENATIKEEFMMDESKDIIENINKPIKVSKKKVKKVE